MWLLEKLIVWILKLTLIFLILVPFSEPEKKYYSGDKL